MTGISQTYLCVLKNSKKAFKSSIISSASAILNIVLNAILIFGLLGFPKMGIAGAALATVMAKTIEVLWCILETLKKHSIKLKWVNFTAQDSALRRKFWKIYFSRPRKRNCLGVRIYHVLCYYGAFGETMLLQLIRLQTSSKTLWPVSDSDLAVVAEYLLGTN